ncbi:MAG: cytochrome c biogenesis protein CcsA [Saprospiraceae bacterium]
MLKKISNRLFSTSAAGLYMILFAIAIAVATFIENDFGTSSAQKVIFKSRWFELLLILFGISILINIFRYRMLQQKKWSTFAFHASILIILLGAGVTRYFGFEGMMHIREGESANSFLSFEDYLVFEAKKNGKKYSFDEPVLFATLGNNDFKESFVLGNREVKVEVVEFLPNPKESLVEDENGLPTLKIVIGGKNGREEYFLQKGKRSRIRGTLFNFTETTIPQAFNIQLQNGELSFTAPTDFSETIMASQTKSNLPANQEHFLRLKSLYSNGLQNFVFGDFKESARLEIVSTDQKMTSRSTGGLKVKASCNGEEIEQMIYGAKGIAGRPKIFGFEDFSLAISYGAKERKLPFSLRLRDFILEKYPGTNSASSYASEVTLVDSRKSMEQDSRIFMNNILDHDGYRFFQSSFDQDELGTWLSVNNDWWGTWISYLGYAILTIGMFLTFFDKKSRFQQLARNLKKKEKVKGALATLLVGMMMSISSIGFAAPSPIGNIKTIDINHAEKFGLIIMQDHRGRMKPMNTYTSEILRKLSRNTSLYGMTSEQIILGMAAHPKSWYDIPLIKVGKHEKTKKILPQPVQGNLISYSDFFNKDGSYKLREHVRTAYNTPKKDRGVFEKEMMKLDEKVNICSMVFSGGFMKTFPIPKDENNTWESPGSHSGHNHAENTYPNNFYDTYITNLNTAMTESNWIISNKLLTELEQYQFKYGSAVIPSDTQRKAELMLNKMDVFSRLGKAYGILGLLYLVMMFASVFKPNLNLNIPSKIAFGFFSLCFSSHLIGLGLRWYVSGRAPWSNGYESMIYIAFTTVLAGMIFGRKSLGGMTATNILSSTILLVAGLSWMDPEITPLVPVLRSYWLTIHVSLEAGSYGFLMLGALIGALNLIFIIFRNQKNAINVNRMVKEMTQISEMTLIGGLFMISVGTYLGGVWANESWGRYWGWDAKETWALVTILIYAFILHMRFIPGMRGAYAFNVASLFGWASVIMTYFGVNYYLSGLHSYAAGDPVPIPSFVYYAVGVLTVIGILAGWRNKVYQREKR